MTWKQFWKNVFLAHFSSNLGSKMAHFLGFWVFAVRKSG